MLGAPNLTATLTMIIRGCCRFVIAGGGLS